MNNKDFQPNWRSLRLIFATLLLTLSTYTGLKAQCPSPTLCSRLATIQPSTSTIDLNTNTNTLPNSPLLPSYYKYANKRLVLVANMVTVTNSIVEFNDCDIRIAEDGGFTVPAGKVLSFNNCRIAAMDCSKLWAGIILSGGSLKMTNNNHVEDARSVITMSIPSPLVCENNLFNRNYIGLSIGGYSGNTKFSFKSNTIQKNCQLIPKTPTIPNIGVFSSQSSGVINLIDNNFIGLNCGIKASKSNISIKGGSFVNIRDDDPKLIGSGCGIYAFQESLISVDNVTFNGCIKSALNLNLSKLECQNSTFTNTKYNAITIDEAFVGVNKIIRNTFNGLNL